MPFLDWVNKAQAQRATAEVPYHLLQFQSAHGDPAADNLLIQGDNLLALKALLPFYRGRVKCIVSVQPNHLSRRAEPEQSWYFFKGTRNGKTAWSGILAGSS